MDDHKYKVITSTPLLIYYLNIVFILFNIVMLNLEKNIYKKYITWFVSMEFICIKTKSYLKMKK